ncbi:MAG TPA: alpha/beta hydrolase [Candidatus Nanoarchaeia archaeon]|nr:alpha/beta hydrolase [Candidatus Nanoarchaeia archaeon]
MKIKLTSFEVAANVEGDRNADRLALILPGQLDSKDYQHIRSHTNFLARKGFLSVSFDPAGTWESGDDLSIYTMTNYLKTINELIHYFGNRPTFTMGHSRGGTMAMAAGIGNPSVFSFAAVMSGYSYSPKVNPNYSDKKEWMELGYRESLRDLPNDHNQSRLFKLPYGFLEDTLKYDLTDGLKNCTKPKMFVYGNKDDQIRPEFVKQGFELSSDPKELNELESDHDYRWHPELITEVNDLVWGFLKNQ